MPKAQAYLITETIISNDSEAFSLFEKSRFGERVANKIHYMLPEALYLLEKGKINLIEGKKELSFNQAIEKLKKKDKKIQTKFAVYKDLREKGFIPKTALKFGADFRVYDKGDKPGEEHARWIVFTDNEINKFSWQDFSAKNRVAHSTKKKLLLAIVDEEFDVTYYEVDWVKL